MIHSEDVCGNCGYWHASLIKTEQKVTTLQSELEKAEELIEGCVKELDSAGGSENEWTSKMSKRLTTFLNEGKK